MKKVSSKFKNKKIMVLVLVLILVLVVFCFYKVYEKAFSMEKISSDEVEAVENDKIMERLYQLNKKNNEVIGWIRIDNSKINYPVLYSGDDYYLRRDYDKNYKREGSIYVDKHNKLDDVNLIIHGHNLDTGTMFTDLLKYKEETYYNRHKTIDFYTVSEGYSKYEIISVFLSKVYEKDDDVFKYYNYYGDIDQKEYSSYINNIKKKSLYDIDVNASYPEKLITLSTCEFSTDNGRMVVVAKNVES